MMQCGVVWCNVAQCGAVCCTVLQYVTVCCSVLQCVLSSHNLYNTFNFHIECVAACSSVLQCVAACYSVLQCVAVCYSMLKCVEVCCSMLQHAATSEKCSRNNENPNTTHHCNILHVLLGGFG